MNVSVIFEDRTNESHEIMSSSLTLFNLFRFIYCLGLELSWCVVFVCRLWWSWIRNIKFSDSSKTKANTRMNNTSTYFITKPAYFSVEINAHNLLYLVLLVQQKQLPKEALDINLFNSQACESVFRNTRSLSGTFSTVVNFTVNDFLHRSRKLSMLNVMKSDQSSEKFSFPVHHKHKREDHSLSLLNLEDVDELDTRQIILKAYQRAVNLIEHSKMSILLKERGLFGLEPLSKYVYNELKSNSRLYEYSAQKKDEDDDEFELEEEDGETNDAASHCTDLSDELLSSQAELDDITNIREEIISSTKSNFVGINIVDKVSPEISDSYFKININDEWQYLHKETACWILTDSKSNLSSDRLSRVIQTGKQE